MTKVGRVNGDTWDYSPSWLKKSIERSMERLKTPYLDVVFCHDIEGVSDNAVLEAVGVLLDFVQQDRVRYIGLSSYRISSLVRCANLVREKYGQPIDVVQNWGQLTLQNSRLESDGLESLKNAGVLCVFNSSPLVIGLLRQGGVPKGQLGDFHPAPPKLRATAQDLADYVESQGESLASLALRYSLWRAHVASQSTIRVVTITGISTIVELDENVMAATKLLGENLAEVKLNNLQLDIDRPLYAKAHSILGDWLDWSFPF
jgi:D-arabinose 1-dehydrogenase